MDVKKKISGHSQEKRETFSAEEQAAMRDRARELRASSRAEKGKIEGENAVLAKIAEMEEPDRTLAEKIHHLIKANAPGLTYKTWYGMPAYVKDGKVICFFQAAQKFGARYATLGFTDAAHLDEGFMWPTAFALKGLTDEEESRIAVLIQKAVKTPQGNPG